MSLSPKILMGLLLAPAFLHGQTSTKAAEATPPPPTPAPTVVKTAEMTVEVGELDHVPYRMDVPSNWNHNLIVYFHGYTQYPLHYRAEAPSDRHLREMFKDGYAVVQSAYGEIGWALEAGFNDSEKLRKLFVKRYGQPRETYLVGGSLGGALVMETMERNPKPYRGALNLCGAVGPATTHLNRRFAIRAAFDYYFPGVMPTLVPTPPNYVETEAQKVKIRAALAAKPASADAMRNLMGLHTNGEVANMISYYTYVVADLQKKAGGNPFENRNTIYTGTSTDSRTDYALNDGVVRYSAEPRAYKYLYDHYTPSGRVTKPVVALHTIYDPTIPAGLLTAYHQTVDAAGFGRNYVQQYVRREGHCTMSPEEDGRAFDELITWVHTGKAPLAGPLK